MLDDIKDYFNNLDGDKLLDKQALIQAAGSLALTVLVFYLARKQIKAAPKWGRVVGFILLTYTTFMVAETIRQALKREQIKDEAKSVAASLGAITGTISATGRRTGLNLPENAKVGG